ncbi:MAG TPA: NUDIX domain-containing protein [Candidatus Saccharimonadales bacterium]
MQDNDIIQEVDENDQSIGGVARKVAKSTGRKYRIVRIMVEDEDSNILIQKRVATKDTYPNCWDNSAAGHVDLGETYEEAAARELAEEIGVREADLEEVRYFYSETMSPNGRSMNRFTKIFRTTLPHDTQFVCQPSEVSEVKWITREELDAVIDEGNVTDGLLQTYERYYKA